VSCLMILRFMDFHKDYEGQKIITPNPPRISGLSVR